ncbi:hypothetical protein CI610_02271 [invertebrate metagenome]|uniref:Endonuclease/exonuclease/phosphatase domain-containing protein n=1 Tax=invertebrate metagenome TaxID=1711999 RepID=A0A2H9T6E0_9ZZZZ
MVSNTNNFIIQWNIRGLRANLEEFQNLSKEFRPALFCLQEVMLKNPITFRNFSLYNSIATVGNRGGAAVAVHKTIPHRIITLNTNLQAVAVCATLHRQVTVCSIYLPPSIAFTSEQLNNLVSQLPAPYIILGDFNGHNSLWGSPNTDERGRRIEEFIDKNNLCLFNNNTPTYLHPATGSRTHIDLSLCHPSILLDYDWRVNDDLCGSDHFPIFLKNIGNPLDKPLPRWNVHKADWGQFQHLCNEELTVEKFTNLDDPIKTFNETITSIATKTIPKSVPKPTKFLLSEESFINRSGRKAALRRFLTSPTTENYNNFKIWRAKARRSIKSDKKNSWKEYISKISSNTSSKKIWDQIEKLMENEKRHQHPILSTVTKSSLLHLKLQMHLLKI